MSRARKDSCVLTATLPWKAGGRASLKAAASGDALTLQARRALAVQAQERRPPQRAP